MQVSWPATDREAAAFLLCTSLRFDNVVVELLQSRNASEPMGGPNSFAPPVQNMSPAFPRMMHICFYVRDDVDFNTLAARRSSSVRTRMIRLVFRTGSPSSRTWPRVVSR